MKNRELFVCYPHIGYKEILLESEFFYWLQKRNYQKFTNAVQSFLRPYGYRITKHTLHKSQVNRLNYVFKNQHLG